MSLTRDDFVAIWESIKRIERMYNMRLPPKIEDITFIKTKIEEVIGQME